MKTKRLMCLEVCLSSTWSAHRKHMISRTLKIRTVRASPCRACRMKLLTTRPSFMCIREPNVLKILATLTSTPSCGRRGWLVNCVQTPVVPWFLCVLQFYNLFHYSYHITKYTIWMLFKIYTYKMDQQVNNVFFHFPSIPSKNVWFLVSRFHKYK